MNPVNFDDQHAEAQPALSRRWKWRVLLSFCAFYSLSYLGRFNFSLIQTAIIEDLGITRADTGWINSWMFWGFAFGGIFHGRIAERIGYRIVILYGAIGIGVFNFLASHSGSVNELLLAWALAIDLVGRQLAGTGTGLLSVHGYIYGAMQAWLFGLLSMVDGGWVLIFGAMALARFLSVAAISRVRA